MTDTSESPREQRPDHGAQGVPAGEKPGDRIDRYTLVAEIGEGGMGTVWRARQEEPVQREVALKSIKLGMDTRQVVARFEAERQALALMDHPSIAKVYDAGVTETGRPYFVMELVQGAPITEFCDRQGLSIAGRLALFRQVCLAVQHAHQKGVLHRDLKPSNILVTEVDGVPQPKVIDFGIAKAMEKPLTDSSLATEEFQVMGTPEYMPPEQASGFAVDTRADVYSLGVVLYELLTGAPPFERGTGGLAALNELLNQIHDVTPPKPSTRVSGLGGETGLVAQRFGSHPTAFRRSLRGDLDWIAMKALEKDRERRYATALELAEDVARHLANQPVVASPPSTTYVVRKFVRRNRLAVGSAAVVLGTLVVSIIGLWMLYSRAVASEELATTKAETSRQALDFMIEMFEVSDPSESRGETVTAREILDRGAERIDQDLADQPEIRSTLAGTMGFVYRGLGLYDRAEELMGSAASIQRELKGEEHPETLRLSYGLGDLWMRLSRFEDAERLLRETLERQERLLGLEHIDTLHTLLALTSVLRHRSELDEAEALAREALEKTTRTLGEDHQLTLLALNTLGIILEISGRYEEAEEQILKGLEVRRRASGDDHPETLIVVIGLGELYMNMGRFEEAEAQFDQAQATARRVFGEEHPSYAWYSAKLGLLYYEQQRWAEAEEVYREIVEIDRRILGNDHLDTLLAVATLGSVLLGEGRIEEAEPYYLESLEGLRRKFGDESVHTLSAFGNMAILRLTAGQLEEAEHWARMAYEGTVTLHGEDHPEAILRLENLANVVYKMGGEAEAAEILWQVLEGRRRALGNEHPAVTRTLVNISVVCGSMGDAECARAAREELLERTLEGLGFDYSTVAEEIEDLAHTLIRDGEIERAADCVAEVLRIRRTALGREDPATLLSMRDYLRAAILLERWDEVEALGRECHETYARVHGPTDPKTVQCLQMLVEAYEEHGDEERLELWGAKLLEAGG